TVGGKPDPKGGVVCPASELDSTPASESHAISDFRIAEILAALVRLRRDGAFDEGSEVVALVAGLRDVMREFEMVGDTCATDRVIEQLRSARRYRHRQSTNGTELCVSHS